MIPIAISPCPNDTFLFHGWISGVLGKTFLPSLIYADIDQLNRWAIEKKFPIIKVSISCLGKIVDDYQLLPVGSALGQGCGPKIIAKSPFSLEELPKKRIAIPGRDTTAHLLLQTLAPSPSKKIFCLYHEISSLLNSDQVDCGLIIHESRFTFEREGFVEIADLGVLWEQKFALPLPLGGIVIKRDLSHSFVSSLISYLQASLQYAWNHPDQCRSFITLHSQEKEWGVIRRHIDLYVSEETFFLSATGIQAIKTLLSCGEKLGLYHTKNIYDPIYICDAC